MNAHRRLVAALIAGALVALVLGGIFFDACSGGVSLMLFGVAAGLMGGVVAIEGGYAVLIPAALMVALLVGAGAYVAITMGCPI